MQQQAIGETIGGCSSRPSTGSCRSEPSSAWAAGDFRGTLDGDDQRHWERKTVSEPLSPERFAVLVGRAGLALTPEQFEELRQGYGFVERMIRTVRRPRDRASEPAHIFVHPRV